MGAAIKGTVSARHIPARSWHARNNPIDFNRDKAKLNKVNSIKNANVVDYFNAPPLELCVS